MVRIVTVTLNPAIDESTTVDRVVPEDKLRCDRPRFEPGGGGLNVARVLHRLGHAPLALWTRAGPAGAQLAALVDETGIPHQGIEVSGLTRTNVVVYERSSTHQFRFGMPGPELTAADLEAVMSAVEAAAKSSDLLVLSGSLPPGAPLDLYARLAERAGEATRVVLDSSGPALVQGLEAQVFLAKPNLRELSQLTGMDLEDDQQIHDAARALVASGRAAHVIVSLGAGGALAVDAEQGLVARAPTVPIRSKVGAGDSMVAGIVSAIAEGGDLAAMVRRGVAAGAGAVMTPGSELCHPQDVRRLEAATRCDAL